MTLIDDGFSNRFTFQKRRWSEVKSGFTHFQDGDVGLAKITPCLENRKSVVFRGLMNGIGAGTTELHIFRPICECSIEPNYLLWFIKSEYFISECIGAFSGAVGQQRVGKDFVANIIIPLPPLAEQKRIVAAIESAFIIINEIEYNKTDLQVFVTAAKSKILSLAIRGKLVPQDPTDEPASVLLERIRKEREKLIKTGKIKRGKAGSAAIRGGDNSYYENLPDGWIAATVEWLFLVVGGGTPSTSRTEYWGNGIPWFSSADIDDKGIITPRRYVTQLGLDNSTVNVVPKGNIVVVTRVGLGKVAILDYDMCFSQDNQALIPHYSDVVDNCYLYHFLFHKMQTLKDFGRGTTISGITKKQLADITLLLPPIAEQRRIVAIIETTYKHLDKIAESLI
jgi:type I restriction enzyme S subunit